MQSLLEERVASWNIRLRPVAGGFHSINRCTVNGVERSSQYELCTLSSSILHSTGRGACK